MQTRSARKNLFCEGIPSPFPEVEHCTYRELIQYFYFVDIVSGKCQPKEGIKEIAENVTKVWRKIHSHIPLIAEKSVVNKIKRVLETVKSINQKLRIKKQKDALIEKLDKIFDICACECTLKVVPCHHSRVHCKLEKTHQKHAICVCPQRKNIPKDECAYVKDQRARNGSKGTYQMSSSQKLSVPKTHQQILVESETCFEQAQWIGEESTDTDWKPKKIPSAQYNLTKLLSTGAELVRAGISSTAGAAIVNAVLQDHQNILKDDIKLENIYVDKCKIDRAKEQAHRKWGTALDCSSALSCIGVDGKVDERTLEYEEVQIGGQTLLKKIVAPQHHLTITNETGNTHTSYLTHQSLPLKGATGSVIAHDVFNVLEKYESTRSLLAIHVDNTPVNTGCNNGMVAQLEILLTRKVHMIGCSLHQNELPFRAVFRKLDGETTGPRSFMGPIGKLCSEDLHAKPPIKFVRLPSCFPGFNLNEMYEDLSCDQKLLLLYVRAIVNGYIDVKLSTRKIGKLSNSRWLTLATRILSLYVKTEDPTENLIKLVHFIISVYAPAWFGIKKSNSLRDAPEILFHCIQALHKMPYDDVREVAFESIQRNGYCLLPENILYAMITSDIKDMRRKGWTALHDLRRRSLPFQRKIPRINWETETWDSLINFASLDCYNEPPTIAHACSQDLRRFAVSGERIEIINLKSHSQSVERSVKLVSEASEQKYGFEGRHASILLKMTSREMRPSFISKQYYTNRYTS